MIAIRLKEPGYYVLNLKETQIVGMSGPISESSLKNRIDMMDITKNWIFINSPSLVIGREISDLHIVPEDKIQEKLASDSAA